MRHQRHAGERVRVHARGAVEADGRVERDGDAGEQGPIGGPHHLRLRGGGRARTDCGT